MLILIAGITGNLGQRLASAALSRGLQVRGLGRNPDNLNSELRHQLEDFVKSKTYYDITALDKAVSGVDAVLAAYSPDPILDLDANLLLLRAAERTGIKIFVASSWNNDWTRIKHGDFEFYDTHIAFEKHAAMTSPIKPVYFFTGQFADLIFTPYGPGGFELANGRGQLSYWGEGDRIKYPWSTTEDIAAWTIEVLINGKGVQEGKGGFFRFRSGEHTLEELAAIYEKVTGTPVDVVRQGDLEDLQALVANERKTKDRTAYFDYLPQAATLLGTQGIWKLDNCEKLDHIRAPTPMEEWLKTQKK